MATKKLSALQCFVASIFTISMMAIRKYVLQIEKKANLLLCMQLHKDDRFFILWRKQGFVSCR